MLLDKFLMDYQPANFMPGKKRLNYVLRRLPLQAVSSPSPLQMILAFSRPLTTAEAWLLRGLNPDNPTEIANDDTNITLRWD